MAGPRTITIVLVHGAFAESLSNWKPVLGLLLAKGYKVVAAPNPLRGVSSDAAYFRAAAVIKPVIMSFRYYVRIAPPSSRRVTALPFSSVIPTAARSSPTRPTATKA